MKERLVYQTGSHDETTRVEASVSERDYTAGPWVTLSSGNLSSTYGHDTQCFRPDEARAIARALLRAADIAEDL